MKNVTNKVFLKAFLKAIGLLFLIIIPIQNVFSADETSETKVSKTALAKSLGESLWNSFRSVTDPATQKKMQEAEQTAKSLQGSAGSLTSMAQTGLKAAQDLKPLDIVSQVQAGIAEINKIKTSVIALGGEANKVQEIIKIIGQKGDLAKATVSTLGSKLETIKTSAQSTITKIETTFKDFEKKAGDTLGGLGGNLENIEKKAQDLLHGLETKFQELIKNIETKFQEFQKMVSEQGTTAAKGVAESLGSVIKNTIKSVTE